LKNENDTSFPDDESTAGYSYGNNELSLWNGNSGLKDAVASGGALDWSEAGTLYNEMWHAFYDQLLEVEECYKWAYDIFVSESMRIWGGLEFGDEAMSSAAGAIANALAAFAHIEEMIDQAPERQGKYRDVLDLSYNKLKQKPGHSGPGERFEGEDTSVTGTVMSQDMYDLVLYLMFFGDGLPGPCLPTDGQAAIMEAIRARLRAWVPGYSSPVSHR
jgi:hypothetical protein